MLWPDIIQFGRITSDVITGMSVTQFLAVGHIASFGWFVTDPFAFVTLDGSFFWMLRSHTRVMGRVLDVVWHNSSVTKAKSRLYPHRSIL